MSFAHFLLYFQYVVMINLSEQARLVELYIEQIQSVCKTFLHV